MRTDNESPRVKSLLADLDAAVDSDESDTAIGLAAQVLELIDAKADARLWAAMQATLAHNMKSTSEGRWVTVFARESKMSKAARFQVTVAEPATDAGSAVSLMTFEISARSELAQILFFKFRAADVTLRHASGRVTIDAQLLATIGPAIREMVSAYTRSFIENLPI